MSSWERISRALLGMVIGFIIISASYTFRNDGFSIATNLSEMVPSTDAGAAHRLAVKAAQEAAGKSVIVMLESSDQASLDQAVVLLDAELAEMSAWLQRQNFTDLTQLISTDFAPYRFHLLTNEDSAALTSGDYDSLVEQALSDLYSPSGGLRLLPLNQDPFSHFSRYIEAGIGRAEFASPVSSLPESSTNDDNAAGNPVVREIITLRLMTEPNALPDDLFDSLNSVLGVSYPTVRLLKTGVLFFSQEAASDAKHDINIITAGSIAGVSVLLLLVFRSIRPLLTASLSILLGVGFAFTVVHLAYGSIHVFTILFGASLIGIVIDYSIHYYYHCIAGQIIAEKPVTNDNLHTDNRPLYRALLISLVTSIAGFSALLFSNVVLLQKIAVFSICGITAAWLTVLALAPNKNKGAMTVRQHLINPMARTVSNVAATVLDWFDIRFALFAVAMILAGVITWSKAQDDPRRFVNLSEDLLQQSIQIKTVVNDLEPGKFFIVEAKDEQTLFDRLDVLYATVGNRARLISVFDWLPSPAAQKNNYQMQEPLFDDAGPVNDLFMAAGGNTAWLTSLQSDYRRSAADPLTSMRFFDLMDGRMSPMVVATEVDKTNAQKQSLAAYVLVGTGADLENVKRLTADINGVSYVDTIANSSSQLREQRRSSLWLLLLAYAAVAMLMVFLYRDRRALVMTAVPAVSTILTLGVLLSIGQPLTLFHTMSLFLILGLGMDYVVFLNEMTDDQKTTRQAILLSGLTSMLSFGLLAASSVPVAKAFGLTILIGNSFNVLATLGLSKSVMWHRLAHK